MEDSVCIARQLKFHQAPRFLQSSLGNARCDTGPAEIVTCTALTNLSGELV